MNYQQQYIDKNLPLPKNVRSIGGNVYLQNYKHPLPNSLQSIGDHVYITNAQQLLLFKSKVKIKGNIYILKNGGYKVISGYKVINTNDQIKMILEEFGGVPEILFWI